MLARVAAVTPRVTIRYDVDMLALRQRHTLDDCRLRVTLR